MQQSIGIENDDQRNDIENPLDVLSRAASLVERRQVCMESPQDSTEPIGSDQDPKLCLDRSNSSNMVHSGSTNTQYSLLDVDDSNKRRCAGTQTAVTGFLTDDLPSTHAQVTMAKTKKGGDTDLIPLHSDSYRLLDLDKPRHESSLERHFHHSPHSFQHSSTASDGEAVLPPPPQYSRSSLESSPPSEARHESKHSRVSPSSRHAPYNVGSYMNSLLNSTTTSSARMTDNQLTFPGASEKRSSPNARLLPSGYPSEVRHHASPSNHQQSLPLNLTTSSASSSPQMLSSLSPPCLPKYGEKTPANDQSNGVFVRDSVDADIEEHFRKSLGKNYPGLLPSRKTSPPPARVSPTSRGHSTVSPAREYSLQTESDRQASPSSTYHSNSSPSNRSATSPLTSLSSSSPLTSGQRAYLAPSGKPENLHSSPAPGYSTSSSSVADSANNEYHARLAPVPEKLNNGQQPHSWHPSRRTSSSPVLLTSSQRQSPSSLSISEAKNSSPPSQITSHASDVDSGAPPEKIPKAVLVSGDVDDHFAKSLGKTWADIKVREEREKMKPGDVDDHFAKALGDTWLQLKANDGNDAPEPTPTLLSM